MATAALVTAIVGAIVIAVYLVSRVRHHRRQEPAAWRYEPRTSQTQPPAGVDRRDYLVGPSTRPYPTRHVQPRQPERREDTSVIHHSDYYGHGGYSSFDGGGSSDCGSSGGDSSGGGDCGGGGGGE